MKKSIATVCISGTLEEKLAAASAAGFDAVEIFENDLICFDGSPRDVKAMADELGLEIALYQPFRDFEGMPDELFAGNLRRAERKFELMHQIGAPMLLVCSNVSPHALGDMSRIIDQLGALADRAAQFSIQIGYEALAWGRHVRHVEQVWRVVQAVNHPHLGVLLDSFHMLALGDDPDIIKSIPGDKIAFVQIADAPKMHLDPLTWSRHFRKFPGQGDWDLVPFIQNTLESGYSGPLSLEVFNDEFRGDAARPIARDGFRSLLFLEEQVRLRMSAAGQKPESGLHDPPPSSALAGVSFLEFAVDGETSSALGAWLQRLSFKIVGRHLSKDVSLWRSGDVSLVLNVEPHSFARSYFAAHGPAICAMAIATEKALSAYRRAIAYQCTSFTGKTGPGEHVVPAVRTPDGSLIYFVDERDQRSLLEDDFGLTAPADRGHGIHLTAIDHIALALPGGQQDTWVLFYRAVLGLEPMDTVVLSDPNGLVRSRSMVDKDRKVRLPLNFTSARETSTARSIATQFGSGVHHIAFECSDLFAFADQLAESNAPVLPIPDNYYGDLIARFDLAPDYVDKLQSRNMLYDRIGTGTFLHIYTESFDDRFFLEFVQRIGGYQDYGAANAAVRMAAHARLARHRQP